MSMLDIFLSVSVATLLSGVELGDCVNGTDVSCVTGVAHFDAFRRHKIPKDAPQMVLPFLDQKSVFVARHPLSYSVNRLVLQHLMGYKLFTGFVSLALQDPTLYDPTPLQSTNFPFLLSDIGIPATSDWRFFHEAIYWDSETHVALISLLKTGSHLHLDPMEITRLLLDEIARQNQQMGCSPQEMNPAQMTYDAYAEQYLSAAQQLQQLNTTFSNQSAIDDTNSGESSSSFTFCWIPVVWVAGFVNGEQFLEQIIPHTHPPAAIVLAPNSDALYLSQYTTPTLLGNTTWVCSARANPSTEFDLYTHLRLRVRHHHDTTRRDMRTTLEELELVEEPLSELPEEWKDDLYHSQIEQLNQMQQEIIANNPIVGYTTEIPDYFEPNNYRCLVGECAMGNLFTDALRWKAGAQISFLTTLLFQGSGWPAGPVHENEVWNAVSFPHTLCTGTISGLTLFKLLNFSSSINSFGDGSTFQLNDGEFMQVSGMKYTYNSQLTGSRITDIQVWNESSKIYQPLERLRVYSVATNAWLCQLRQPFSSFLSASALTLPGEEPFRISNTVQHAIVTEYLSATSALENPLNLTPNGRINEDTSQFVPLEFIQDADSCESGTTWTESQQSCLACPDTAASIQWNRAVLEMNAISGSDSGLTNNVTITLLNGAPVSVIVRPTLSFPSWLIPVRSILKHPEIDNGSTTTTDVTGETSVNMSTGDRLVLSLDVDAHNLAPGLILSTVSFSISDGGQYPGCNQNDVTFDISLTIFPEDNKIHLGNIRYVGWVLTFVTLAGAGFCGSMTIWKRKHQFVRFLQPTFLVLICVGVAIMALAMTTLSFDDDIVSVSAMDGICMATPWLLSVGFSISFSSLFSKLWRVNHLFNSGTSFRRTKVEAKDAAGPFAVMLFLNMIVLLLWSIIDPLQWVRKPVDNAEWNTYGVCESENAFGEACAIIVIVLNILALMAACFQAYKARELGNEFAESQSIGVAIYSWFQLLLVSVPVLFITTDDNVEAQYFLQIGIIFAVCATMLVCLFAPLLARQGRSVDSSRSRNFQQSSEFGSGADMQQDASISYRIAGRVSGLTSQQPSVRQQPRTGQKSSSIISTSEMSVQFTAEEECNPAITAAAITEDADAVPDEAVANIDQDTTGVYKGDKLGTKEIEEETIVFEVDDKGDEAFHHDEVEQMT